MTIITSVLFKNLSELNIKLYDTFFSLSIQRGIFPDELKVSRIAPLYDECD